jgi:hypothetical protein
MAPVNRAVRRYARRTSHLRRYFRGNLKICHYTSLEGAIGIISTGDLWLTNSRYSNDDEELKHGHRLVDAVREELENEARRNAPRLEWLRKMRSGGQPLSSHELPSFAR